MKCVLLQLVALCIFSVWGEHLEKIEQCGARCSQGLPCKAKPYWSFAQCKSPPNGADKSVFSNTSISTVMRCRGKQHCSLHLRVSTHLRINKHIHGVYLCMISAGMMERCRIINFERKAREKLAGKKVHVHDDCLEVGLGQDVHVTLQTWPQFCDVGFSGSHHVPDCRHNDLQRHVAECITGSINYEVDMEKKKLHISVSNMLEDRDYYVRLCLKDYICTGVGAHAVLKKENPQKNITLEYNKLLPCLCIEGWSVMTDAPRVQVCPFKKHLKELWSGITFDPVEETLSWEPECHVSAVVTLCEMQEHGVCENLAHSTRTYSKKRVTYSSVDPHPRLCMKFITENGELIKCPFSEEHFPVWTLEVSALEGQPRVILTSRIRTSFSVSLCAKTSSTECEDTHTVLVAAENFKPVQPNLTVDLCEQSHCIKAKRVDVKYGVTALYCQPPCSRATFMSTRSGSEWQSMHIMVPAVTLTTAVAMVAIMTAVAMIGYKMKQTIKARGVSRLPGPHTALFSSKTEESNLKTQLTCTMLGDEYSTESPQLRHCERSNLLQDFTNNLKV